MSLENTGWRLFLSEMQEWYHHEFPQLSNEWKDKAIEYIILNNASIFQKEDVLKENLCNCCGRCCQEIGCPDWDSVTKLCTKHDNQNSIICSLYPWDDEVGMIFTLNCAFERRYIKGFLDNFFTKAVQMREKK